MARTLLKMVKEDPEQSPERDEDGLVVPWFERLSQAEYDALDPASKMYASEAQERFRRVTAPLREKIRHVRHVAEEVELMSGVWTTEQATKDFGDAVPWTPKDIQARAIRRVPPHVVAAVNHLIDRHWDGRTAKFSRDDLEVMAASMYARNHPGMLRTDERSIREFLCMSSQDLRIEGMFSAVGWDIQYDRSLRTYTVKAS